MFLHSYFWNSESQYISDQRAFVLLLSMQQFFWTCYFILGILVADLSSDDPELTHMLCESLLISDAQITPGGEEASQSACSRLQQAVETLLDLLNQANAQVKHKFTHWYLNDSQKIFPL